MCLIYTREEERIESLAKFILSGLEENDRCACFSSKTTEENIRDFFDQDSHQYDEHKRCGDLTMAGTREVYFKGKRFFPDRMLEQFYESSVEFHLLV